MKVRFKKLHPNAVVPTRAHETDAAYDLVAADVSYDADKGIYTYDFGMALEIPRGYAGFVYPRSSVYKTDLFMVNGVGVIDSGYRGSISAKFATMSYLPDEYNVGDRVAQLIIQRVEDVEFEESETLTDSDRGNGGYGSTGR